MIIAVEGIDGSGKTTICKEIAKTLNFDFVEKALQKTLGLQINEYINMREKLKENTIARNQIMSMFFGMNNILCGTMGATHNIVSDRYIATNYYWYGCNETDVLFDAIIQLIKKPFLTVLLNVSQENLTKRILSREYTSKEYQERELKLTTHASSFLDKSKHFLSRHNYNYIVVDNNKRSINSVVDEIVSNIIL